MTTINSSSSTTVSLDVQDVSGQKHAHVSDVLPDTSVGELVDGLLAELGLPQIDAQGRPLDYMAMHNRERRHLHASERVGEAIETGDSVTLAPNIQAG